RVHRQRLTRTDPEEPGIELRRVVQETALTHIRRPRTVRIRIVDALHVPATVLGEPRHTVRALGDHPPQVLRRPHVTGVTARHADDDDGVVVGDGRGGGGGGRGGGVGGAGGEFAGQGARGR